MIFSIISLVTTFIFSWFSSEWLCPMSLILSILNLRLFLTCKYTQTIIILLWNYIKTSSKNPIPKHIKIATLTALK
ncbi:unnamed protein product [Blepharisma stoltei]|uniref:ATP synthase F0 subunit 8 n=1 Tax=Blepharisma stoltei TaxID=1481888 RepID=A0AAU9K3G7_9CILI|nr:unnamed protein product [Blepharisma stoltei]